jgi:serine/threonine protein kinase
MPLIFGGRVSLLLASIVMSVWVEGSSPHYPFQIKNKGCLSFSKHEFLELARDLLSKLLFIEPFRRISYIDVLQHPFFDGMTLYYDESEQTSAITEASSIQDIENKQYTRIEWQGLCFLNLYKNNNLRTYLKLS